MSSPIFESSTLQFRSNRVDTFDDIDSIHNISQLTPNFVSKKLRKIFLRLAATSISDDLDDCIVKHNI